MLIIKKQKLEHGGMFFGQKNEEFYTTNLFWTCPCNENYLHPCYVDECPHCKMTQDDPLAEDAYMPYVEMHGEDVDPYLAVLACDALEKNKKGLTFTVSVMLLKGALESRWRAMGQELDEVAENELLLLANRLARDSGNLPFPPDWKIWEEVSAKVGACLMSN